MKYLAIIVAASASLLAFAAAADDLKLEDCNNVTPMTEMRRCMGRNIEKLKQAIDKKVFDICAAQVARGGSQGPAAIDERLICRLQRLDNIYHRIF